jgi:hypothetical protein
MSVVIAVLLIAALVAASAWTVLLAIAGAVEVLPPVAAPDSAQGADEVSPGCAARPPGRSEAA